MTADEKVVRLTQLIRDICASVDVQIKDRKVADRFEELLKAWGVNVDSNETREV